MLFSSFSPKVPRTKAGLHCNTNEKNQPCVQNGRLNFARPQAVLDLEEPAQKTTRNVFFFRSRREPVRRVGTASSTARGAHGYLYEVKRKQGNTSRLHGIE